MRLLLTYRNGVLFLRVIALALVWTGSCLAADPGSLFSPGRENLGWEFGNGAEFPGAQGKLSVIPDQPQTGESSLKLEGDFSRGGLHVEASLDLSSYAVGEGARIEFEARSANSTDFVVRLTDESGQCFQKKDFHMASDGKWHAFSVKPADMTGSEHWGGANDGTWHGRPTSIKILLPKDYSAESARTTVDLEIARMRAVSAP